MIDFKNPIVDIETFQNEICVLLDHQVKHLLLAMLKMGACENYKGFLILWFYQVEVKIDLEMNVFEI